MMTFGTKTKKYIATLLLFLSFGLSSVFAQSDKVLAKSYFLKAQQAYSEGNNATALKQLDRTLDYLGSTNPKVEALYVKITLNQKKYANAEKHLNAYFGVADEGHSDYMQMLGYVAEVKEKIAEKKAEEAEYKSKREQKVYNEVVEYFKKNKQICCHDYLEREVLNINWNSAKTALQSVVAKDMHGGSIKNDTLFQSVTSVNMPLNDFKNMTFEVSEAKPNTFGATSSKLTVKSIYGTQIDIYVKGRLNPSFVNKVSKALINVVQQKRVIKYLREHPDKFPKKSQLLNEQSYLFAYGDRKEYDEDIPEGKKEKTESKNESNANDSIVSEEVNATFPGGKTALVKYFSKNIQYPEEAKASQVEGKVYVSFTISKDGSLRDIKAIRGPGFGLNKEAVRLFKNMPKWKPAIEQGKAVAIKMNMPLNFELPKDSIPEKETSLDRWGRSINTLNKTKEENWSTLNQNGYTINYPNNWTIDTNIKGSSGFVMVSPEDNKNKTAFIRMESGELDSDISLKSYAEIYTKGYLKKSYKNINIINNETKEQNGYSYRNIKCSATVKNNVKIDLISNIIIHKKKVYAMLFFIESNDVDSHLSTVEKIFKSFSFL